jgi:hypothetical protein
LTHHGPSTTTYPNVNQHLRSSDGLTQRCERLGHARHHGPALDRPSVHILPLALPSSLPAAPIQAGFSLPVRSIISMSTSLPLSGHLCHSRLVHPNNPHELVGVVPRFGRDHLAVVGLGSLPLVAQGTFLKLSPDHVSNRDEVLLVLGSTQQQHCPSDQVRPERAQWGRCRLRSKSQSTPNPNSPSNLSPILLTSSSNMLTPLGTGPTQHTSSSCSWSMSAWPWSPSGV